MFKKSTGKMLGQEQTWESCRPLGIYNYSKPTTEGLNTSYLPKQKVQLAWQHLQFSNEMRETFTSATCLEYHVLKSRLC